MLSDIFQKLTSFFREKYISSLETFTLKVDSKELKQEIYSKLPEDIKFQLDFETSVCVEVDNRLNQAKQHWDKQVEEKEDGKAGILGKMLHEAAQKEAFVYNQAINERHSHNKLYLVGFDKNLTTKQAKFELLRIGFHPADLLETVLFFQKYQEVVCRCLPIISLEAYFDEGRKVGLLEDNWYALCLESSVPPFFAPIGAVESREFLEAATFRRGIMFLVKPI